MIRTAGFYVAISAAVQLGGVALAAPGPNTGMADARALISAYDRFVGALPDAGRIQTIPLASLRGITSESFNAGGRVRIDGIAGTVTSTVRMLPRTGAFDLWLVDNRAANGHTTLPEPSDLLLKVGTYELSADRGRGAQSEQDARELAVLALEEAIDALEVLSDGALAQSNEAGVHAARAHLIAAGAALKTAERLPLVEIVGNALVLATQKLRMARPELAALSALPLSFQN
jgi:hypothetical protein